jgi:hypothetical protein
MASFVIYGDTSGQVTVQAPAISGSNTITLPAETGTAITSASTTMPNTIVWNTTIQTSSFTATIDSGNFCNTTGGAFTVTLPASPARGDFVVIVDYAGTSATNNITVAGNGANINGTSTPRALQTNRQGITFTYIDSTQGWLATSNIYGGSTPFINAPYTATYLVVAGGGGGGSDNTQGTGSGGGGGGGFLTGSLTLTSSTVYTITIGGGGSGGTSANRGSSGSNSVFGAITATGGGGGAGRNSNNGLSGGSGGGASLSGSPGSGTAGQGNNGGSGTSAGLGGGGGGGGAGAVGTYFSGGNGLQSSITGTATFYAGGGGGREGTAPYTEGSNGAGGGGGINTGGGGQFGGFTGQTGGSGVVIISVPTVNYTGITTGSPTVTTSGSNTILRYTASGTYTA